MAGSKTARWMLALVVAASLASACGGESGVDSGGGSAASSGSSGTSTGGGAGNATGGAGRSASGGAAGSMGGAAGRGGTGGTGGSTGGNAGSAGSGGNAGSAGSGAKLCGGFVGDTCAANEWCNFPDTLCGAADGTGLCELRPGDCDLDCPGVCGCDGNSHCNACIASGRGVDVAAEGNCPGGGGTEGSVCGTDADCSGSLRCCYPCGVPDCQNVCTDTGSGPCQPVP
jgi:hypothetical protein